MMMPGRKYEATNGYRYGFNGQEHSLEVHDNSYTAEYWEYDSRIGRRWNIDPRSTDDVSKYSTLNNNPIVYNDIKEDTARVKWGGLGGNKYNISYVGGKWIDTKTRQEYSATAETPNRVKRQMGDYQILNTISGLQEMVTEINSTSKNIYLRSDEGKTDLAQLYNKKLNGEDISNADIQVGSSGTRFSGEYQMNEKAVEIPSYVMLAHELGHVYDYLFNEKKFNNGFRTFTQKYETQDPNVQPADRTVIWSEITAMYYENVARVHANISPRQYYSSNRGVPEFEGLASIAKKNYELIKLRTGDSRVYRNVQFWDLNGHSVTLLVPLVLLEPATKGKR